MTGLPNFINNLKHFPWINSGKWKRINPKLSYQCTALKFLFSLVIDDNSSEVNLKSRTWNEKATWNEIRLTLRLNMKEVIITDLVAYWSKEHKKLLKLSKEH